MSTSVKHIHNGMRGAPAWNGMPGTTLAALVALFETGWGVTTAVSVNVAGGIATATLTPGETFDRDSVVLVAGATPGALNGESRVLTTSNTSITWATTAPDGAATGAITIKYAPQTSWSKVYAATNKAAYRSTHPQAKGHYTRIDDTFGAYCRVRSYESMSDIDTGTGPFPDDSQMSGGGYLHKSAVANATPGGYRIFCDERTVLFAVQVGLPIQSDYKAIGLRGFGDPLDVAAAGDAWNSFLSVSGPSSSNINTGVLSGGQWSDLSAGATFMPRSVSGLGASVMMHNRPMTGTATAMSGSDTLFGPAPSEVDGRILLSTMVLVAATGAKPPRATVPGVRYVPQSETYPLIPDGSTLDGADDLSGRRLMALAVGSSYNPSGVVLVDITGPWR